MNARDLERFRKLLMKRRAELLSNVTKIENETLGKSRLESGGETSSYPEHLADLASDTYEHDFSLGLLENEKEELQEIDHSLARIEDKAFGKCETCLETIDKARLRAIPYARLCIDCQRKVEAGLGE